MGRLIAMAFWIFAIWLIRRDTRRRDGISVWLWVPTLWAFIQLSRSLSAWLGVGGGVDTMEGSPLDRYFYFGSIFLSLYILSRRNIQWGDLAARNWPIILFYGYMLVSVLWAESSIVSFKRWFKDFGNIFVALVILTEKNPQQAVRAVFVRCAYILLPLSVIFIRFFPELGRRYSRSGGLEVTGVTTQKNSLGVLVLICGLVLLWEWFERSKKKRASENAAERWMPFGLFLIGIYLLSLCDSKTSLVCLILGAGVLSAIKFPLLRKRIGAIGVYLLLGGIAFYALDSAFGLSEKMITSMGRDMTFTGRTDVWRVLLELKTDPVIGTGFCSFWDNDFYQSQLPNWVAFSAHNGYLETYIDGGWIGVGFLTVMLLVIAYRANHQLSEGSNYALLKFGIFLSIVVGSFSESHFGRMGPLWFTFLLTALQVRPRRVRAARTLGDWQQNAAGDQTLRPAGAMRG